MEANQEGWLAMGRGTRQSVPEKALRRNGTIELFVRGELSRKDAALILGKSTRQVSRMVKDWRAEGDHRFRARELSKAAT